MAEKVVVAPSFDEITNQIELTAEDDGTLGLQTLAMTGPGAHGLAYKYKDPGSETEKCCVLKINNGKIYPPSGGWAGKVFVVLFSPVSQNVSKYVPIDVDDFVRNIECYLFYENVGDAKCCFTVISPNHAISFHHDNHKTWKKKEIIVNQQGKLETTEATKVEIFNQQGGKFETTVIECDPVKDYVVVHSHQPLVKEGPVIGIAQKLERYVLLGYPSSSPDADYQALEGIFSSIARDDKGRIRGSSGSLRGYSGGPIFNYRGELLGINVENESPPKFNGFGWTHTIHDLLNEMVLTFPSLSVIVPADCVAFKYAECKWTKTQSKL